MGHITGITLQPQSDVPLYRQLFDQIACRIRNVTFPPGFRLPPTRALAEQLCTHRNTVVHAYEDLEAAGFVRSAVGRGTFVAEKAPEHPVAAVPLRPEPAGLPWASLTANAVAAEALVRSERLAPAGAAGDAINLGRMQPSFDLLPHELLRRCIDHVLRTVGRARARLHAARRAAATAHAGGRRSGAPGRARRRRGSDHHHGQSAGPRSGRAYAGQSRRCVSGR